MPMLSLVCGGLGGAFWRLYFQYFQRSPNANYIKRRAEPSFQVQNCCRSLFVWRVYLHLASRFCTLMAMAISLHALRFLLPVLAGR